MSTIPFRRSRVWLWSILVLALPAFARAAFLDHGVLGQSVLNRPTIVLFYWSSAWDAGNPLFTEAAVNAAVSRMVTGDGVTPSYFTKAAQYSDVSGNVLSPVAVVFADTSKLTPTTDSCFIKDPGSSLNSVTLTAWIQCMIAGTGSLRFAFPPTAGSPDVLPVFLIPAGTALTNDIAISIPVSVLNLISPILAQVFPTGINYTIPIPSGCRDFAAYHAWTSPLIGDPLLTPAKPRSAYAVVPLNCAPTGALATDPSGFYIALDDATLAISHELVEGLTDPFIPFGWLDTTVPNIFKDSEACDVCATNAVVWYQNQVVAAYVSIADGACAAGNGTLNTITLNVAFANGGPAVVPVQLDNRIANLNSTANAYYAAYSFEIQVVHGTTHSYQFPASFPANPVTMRIVPIDNNQPVNGNELILNNITRTVNYKTQFFVTVLAPAKANPTPSGWYDIGNLNISTAASYVDNGLTFLFFRWTANTAPTPQTASFKVNVDQSLFYQADYVRSLAQTVSFTRSGLTYNRKTQIYSGTITLKNNGNELYSNGLPVVLTGLPAGVKLLNQAGTFQGAPWLPTLSSSGFPPGTTLVIPVQFSIPPGVALNYGVTVYSFH